MQRQGVRKIFLAQTNIFFARHTSFGLIRIGVFGYHIQKLLMDSCNLYILLALITYRRGTKYVCMYNSLNFYELARVRGLRIVSIFLPNFFCKLGTGMPIAVNR